MSKSTFNLSESLKSSWEILKNNLNIVVIYTVLSLILTFLASLNEQSILVALIAFFASVISFIIQCGYTSIEIKMVDKVKYEISDLWFTNNRLLTGFLASLLFGVAVILGSFLFIIPGIYLAIRLGFYIYFIIDKDLGVNASLHASWEATRGHVWELFVFALGIIGVNILGALALGIGLLVTVPLTSLATAYIYRKLEKEYNSTKKESDKK